MIEECEKFLAQFVILMKTRSKESFRVKQILNIAYQQSTEEILIILVILFETVVICQI